MEATPLRRRLSLIKTRLGPLPAFTGLLGTRPVVVVVTGMGTALAAAGTEHLLAARTVERVVVVGITGAIRDETPLGALIRPEVVVDGATGRRYRPDPLGEGRAEGAMWTSDELITDPLALADLRGQDVVSLDMETAAVAGVCVAAGVPWSVFRVVSDRATDGSVDDEVFHLSHQDGTPDGKAVAAYLLEHPDRVPGMARMAKAAKLATERAAEAAIEAVGQLPTDGN